MGLLPDRYGSSGLITLYNCKACLGENSLLMLKWYQFDAWIDFFCLFLVNWRQTSNWPVLDTKKCCLCNSTCTCMYYSFAHDKLKLFQIKGWNSEVIVKVQGWMTLFCICINLMSCNCIRVLIKRLISVIIWHLLMCTTNLSG